MSEQSDKLTQQALRAERNLNSYQAKQGVGRQSDSTVESGVNEMAGREVGQDSDIRYGRGSATASGSDRKLIPESEGGGYDSRGRLTQAKHFNGPGGPEDKMKRADEALTPQGLKRHE
ncbi:hypothetical protein ASPZODRAFT_15128 [Penicilliopsis zonata CBS 506.65]|uniref:SMP domain-containing protein n=1 Tax=Penicilliopsis zonata CBS 506.65 TaxID=1073090 RepID=A0A1L9SKQ5_9EURO|nr:hypothetical protein ASPZODRAFT_15128 [Penicilliopsis zonata CBS 506.65]OJJ47681.1 hypothetical protein ASPZODRAFT_15128 [Penicilliopsis zonata CBS 506.65]